MSELISKPCNGLFNLIHEGSISSKSIPDKDTTEGAISLFSGGLDSTGGIFYNQHNNIDATYLSLNYGSGIGPLTYDICEEAGVERSLIGIDYVGSSNEHTQFSRGFLHLIFGVVVAMSQGVQTVQSFENGIVARFSILQEGWMTTRTVSPTFVTLFNSLLDEIDGVSIDIQNPFKNWTKTEVINLIPKQQIVSLTTTCPHEQYFRDHERDNCGLCVPCIIRTISLLASQHSFSIRDLNIHNAFVESDFESMEANFEVNTQRKNFNRDAVGPDIFLKALAEISYFCRQLLYGREPLLAEDYSELYDQTILELHHRFASEFKTAVEKIGEQNPTIVNLIKNV